MPRLRVLSANQVCNILVKHGFVKARQAGSHIIMRRVLPDRNITVPVPNHSEIARGTLKSIILQSELPKSEFMQ
ncbi:MAG TPA: type II toxin-antitoxin system HicA family toxin [Pyrinomonadaceae bacterium]|jgi:predicted RNA binding protein YcfA (HicA-like mRNA interferase family)|nr:type II toxin-antitoxin system HicA family toxin [Pyrinomonadaceae bacterium]